MKKLTPAEEIDFIKELLTDPITEKTYLRLRETLDALQIRSQGILALVTICLTITGFSGIEIASAGPSSRYAIFIGIFSTLITAILLVCGPLQLKWISQFKADDIQTTLEEVLQERDRRTKLYHIANIFLIIGIGGYTMALAFYLLLNA